MTPAEQELVRLNKHLLDSIAAGDWKTYDELCDPTLTCFEPESRGHLVHGMDFHRYYFNLPRSESPKQNTISDPHVRIMGDVAIVSYVRLVQHLDAGGGAVTSAFEETRAWEKQNGTWKHVHFHRSPVQ